MFVRHFIEEKLKLRAVKKLDQAYMETSLGRT